MIFFVQTSLTIFFLTFFGRGLELTQMVFLPFSSNLENGEIMIIAFFAKGNALHEVVELLGHVCLNFTLFLTCCFLPVTPQPLTGISQMEYRWKAVENTPLFRVDQFFILVMVQKNLNA